MSSSGLATTTTSGHAQIETAGVTALRPDPADAVLGAALDLARGRMEPAAAVAALLAGRGVSLETVRQAQARLLAGLARNPFFDAQGVRASRLLFAAADALQPPAPTVSVAA